MAYYTRTQRIKRSIHCDKKRCIAFSLGLNACAAPPLYKIILLMKKSFFSPCPIFALLVEVQAPKPQIFAPNPNPNTAVGVSPETFLLLLQN
jgi:hypothetical protein